MNVYDWSQNNVLQKNNLAHSPESQPEPQYASEKEFRDTISSNDLIEEYIDYLVTVKGYAHHTLVSYRHDLVWLFRFFAIRFLKVDPTQYVRTFRDGSTAVDYTQIDIREIGMSLIQSVRFPDLYAFISFAARDLGNDENSRKRKVTCVKGFFRFLTLVRHYLTEDVSLELEAPKLARYQPHYLTLEQSQDLLEAPKGKYEMRDKAILTIFLNTGLRVSELVNLKLSDIQSDMLHVVGKGNKERNLFLNDACLQSLAEYLPLREEQLKKHPPSPFIFLSQKGGQFTTRGIEHMIEKNIKMIGLDPRRYSVHSLRHTAATLMHKYGAIDIRTLQAVLGHESTQTTEIYTHLDSDELQQALDSNPLAHYGTSNDADVSAVFALNKNTK